MSYKTDLQANNTRLDNLKTEINNLPTFVDTTDATAQSKDIMQGKTAYVNGQKLEGTTDWQNIEWTPQNDWWDIKTIVANDTEDYPMKIIALHDEGAKTCYWNFTPNDASRISKVKFSDGQEITSAQQVTIGENGIKNCSKGYKTFYSIWYFNDFPNFSYTNIGDMFKCSRYIYFYNVNQIAGLSNFYWFNGFNPNIEAIESNIQFNTTIQNMPLILNNPDSLHHLPEYIWRRNGNISLSNILQFNIVPNLSYENISKIIKNRTFKFTSGFCPYISLAFHNKIIDFEKDWGIDTSLFTRFSQIYGPYAVQKLDCTNITSSAGIFGAVELFEVSNIKITNNYFREGCISHDSLVRVLNALWDYSESEDTYTLTIGTGNLNKLTNEEKAIATRKRLDISIGGKI